MKPIRSVIEPKFRQQWREHATRHIWRVTRVYGDMIEIWSPYTGKKRHMKIETFQERFKFELPAPQRKAMELPTGRPQATA